MEDSTYGNDKIHGRGTEKYEKWMWEESNELLKLMVDVVTRDWHDGNGVLSKITIEKHVLPHLNQKLGVEKTYFQYKIMGGFGPSDTIYRERCKQIDKQRNNYSPKTK